ncbi:hypothetical protein [Prescottella agglutinans]|uniref:Uncharacterized protein n=1 Tax=Prescottella agglutinans TaxID=1644129 RepID=A0ABT6MET0_9NOCA|nr:hypothetical protein [Prescottella agglutinans]MDH6282818.1 hypothetical protein [Prescottella agglutinans]
MPPPKSAGVPLDKRVETQERRKLALQLKLEGWSLREIAEDPRIDRDMSVVSRYITDSVKAIPQQAAEEVIQMELARLDAMWKGIWADATHGDTWKIDRALAIMERRAKFLGLDGFVKPDTSKDAKSALQSFLSDVKTAVAEAEKGPEE